MVYRNPEKNCAYTFYTGAVEDLVEEIRGFCSSTYGDECEFRRVEVLRNRSGSSWTLHSFEFMDGEAVDAMRRHLRTDFDSVRVKFGGREEELVLRVCSSGNSSELARFIDESVREEDSLAVLAIDGDLERAEDFLESIE